jgi:O-antigen ligase
MKWILVGYMFLYIHRPFEIWPILGDMQIERVYMICALAFLPFAPGKKWLPDWQHVAHAGFSLAVLLCWLMSPWADYGQHQVEEYFKVVVFFGMFVIVVNDEKTLKFVVTAFLVVMFVYLSHSLLEYARGRYVYRMGIPRLIGVDTTLGQSNSFGTSIVYALPIASALWLGSSSPRVRTFAAVYLGLSTVCIGLTGSRASFLGLLLWAWVLVMRSKHRWRLSAVMLIMSPVLFFMLPESLQNRFTTIIDPSVGPANAQTSAEGRLIGLQTGLEVYSRFPITGVGPGAYRPGAKQTHETHNLYAQVLAEMGTIGAVAFVGVLAAVFFNAWRTRKLCAARPVPRDFLYHLAGGIVLSFFLMLFEGNGVHNLFRFNWLWFGGFLIIACHCATLRGSAVVRRPFRAWAPVPAFPRRVPALG